MPFKNKKNAVKMGVLCILLFIFFVILTKIGVEMEKRSLFNAAIAFRISSFAFYVCFMISFFTIFVKLAVTNRFLIALIYIGLFFVFFGCLSSHYLILNRDIQRISRPTFPERFISNSVVVQQLSSLSEELISRRHIYWVQNRWKRFIFGIGYADGTWVFNSQNIPKDYKFDIPVKVEDIGFVRSLKLYGMPNKQTSDSKVVDKNDFEFCARASALIRRIGFDDVKFYPEPNIVRYEVHDTLGGWDSPVYYYVYYYSQSTQLPDNFKYESKLNDNWYFDSEPRF